MTVSHLSVIFRYDLLGAETNAPMYFNRAFYIGAVLCGKIFVHRYVKIVSLQGILKLTRSKMTL